MMIVMGRLLHSNMTIHLLKLKRYCVPSSASGQPVAYIRQHEVSFLATPLYRSFLQQQGGVAASAGLKHSCDPFYTHCTFVYIRGSR